jgi:monoamine oxidase
LDGARIRYSTRVNKIKTTNDEGDRVLVTTESGETMEFDEVVMTAPLGWLKKHPEAFNPALSPRLTKAIQSIGYGCLEKVGPV